jgi:hypothetical protein
MRIRRVDTEKVLLSTADLEENEGKIQKKKLSESF